MPTIKEQAGWQGELLLRDENRDAATLPLGDQGRDDRAARGNFHVEVKNLADMLREEPSRQMCVVELTHRAD